MIFCTGPCRSFGQVTNLALKPQLASDSIPQCSYLKGVIKTSDYSSLVVSCTTSTRGICGIPSSRQIAGYPPDERQQLPALSETRRRCHYKIPPKLGLERLSKEICSPRCPENFVKQSCLDCEWLCRVLLVPNSSRVDARVQSLSRAGSANKFSTVFLPGAI